MKKCDSQSKGMSYIHEELYNKTVSLREKYPYRSQKTLLSLLVWSFKRLCFSFFRTDSSKSTKKSPKKKYLLDNSKKVSVLFYLAGGLGDVAIAATYLSELAKVVESDISFSIATNQNLTAVKGIFRGYSFIDQIITPEIMDRQDYWDAFIVLNVRFPRVFYRSAELKERVPIFDSFVDDYEEFNKKHEKFCREGASNDVMGVVYSIMNGHTRRTQMDLNHRLEMSEETRPVMMLDKKAFEILSRHDLKGKKYLSFQRGVDVNFKGEVNIRLWSHHYYEELIRKIKSSFPEFTLVQIGKKDSEPSFSGIDLDLRGETSFEELKVILKHSSLHIDGECGMVHLNHALSGRSAVFFGQTNVDFCGYPENINVKVENACPLWCEWVTDSWASECLRGFKNPPCMEKLTPDLFFQTIKKHLQSLISPEYVCEWRETEEKIDNPLQIVFIGDYEEKTILAYTSSNSHVLHISNSMTIENIQKAKKNNYAASLGDALNLPIKSDWADLVFYNGDCGEYEMLELKRITRLGGLLISSDHCWKKENIQKK